MCAYQRVPVWQVIEVRVEAALRGSSTADGAAKPEEELKAWVWPALCCVARALTGDRLRTVHLSLLVNE